MTTKLAAVPAGAPPSLRVIFGRGQPIRLDITHEVYHADRTCESSTGLKLMLRSPKHYRHYADHGRKETEPMFVGSAVHKRVLEPDDFVRRYLVSPVPKRQRNDFAVFKAANADKLILTQEQMNICDGIAASIAEHAEASALLAAGHKEATLIWQDEETGVWLKIRPDCLCIDFDIGICMDLKTTEDCRPEPFSRACERYDYDVSAALYLDGLRAVLNRDFDYAFLPAEKEPPYDIALYGAPDEMIARGRRRYREALRRLVECRRTGVWAGSQPHGGYEILPWRKYAI